MNMQEELKKYFDSSVKGDQEAAKQAYDNYVTAKATQIIKSLKEEKSPIKLKGNDVYVNDKKVGAVNHNVEDGKGIEYTSVDGKVKKSFKQLSDLYAHVGKEHLKEVQDYEAKIKELKNRNKLKKEKAFANKVEQGLDADGDHDGTEDADMEDKKRQAPIKDLISKIKSGNRETKD